MTPNETCSLTSRLSAYLDGELPPEERAALESHLSNCGACAAELRKLQATSQWFARQSPMPRLNPQISRDRTDFLTRLHAAVATQWRQIGPGAKLAATQLMERGWMLRFSRRLAAVAACLAVAGTLWLWHSGALAPSRPMASATLSVPAPWETPAILPQGEGAQIGSSEMASNVSNDVRLSEWIVDDLSRGPR